MSEKEKKVAEKEVDPKISNCMKSLSQLNTFVKKQKKNEFKTFDQAAKDSSSNLEVISTGIPELDEALGNGGLVKGTMVELYGPESSGKSYVSYKIMSSCQKSGGVAALIDAEQAAYKDWLETNGIDTSCLIFENDAISMEDHLQKVYDLCGHVDVIVIDSTAALVPRSEMEGNIGDIGVAAQARVLSQAVRKLTQAIKGGMTGGKKKTLLVWINQIREKVGVRFGNPETTPGGRALKFYSHVRIDVRKIGIEKIKVNDDEVPVCQNSKGTIVKNKMGVPFKKFDFKISFASNLSNPLVMLTQTANKLKIFYKSKGEYRFLNSEGEKVPTGTTDFIALSSWMHKNGLVDDVMSRILEICEVNGEPIPDFFESIDENTKPPLVESDKDGSAEGTDVPSDILEIAEETEDSEDN